MQATARGTSGRDKAYEFLRRTVLTDPAMEGAFISEQDVAEQVGVSRTPVREALLQLAAEDLVQLVPNRGAYVAPLSGRDLRELFELRGMMERFAAHKIITFRRPAPVDEMREVIKQQRATTADHEFITLDHHFHSLMVDAAGNAMLSKAYANLRARQIRAGLIALSRSADRQHKVLSEHDAIVRALAGYDLDSALVAIDYHHQKTLELQLTAT
ncbi:MULTISPECIES: GntR family transcriptional regulator [Amycolatopsis]|uniref:DNA-binding transcriptional regulator, GntR family n=2 Tax=Amycolatopsis TaxID=1813 RepID=A0A1I3UAA3_9PSEU|nr:GntR family transcriptional regulator [Amycolatopsis sacchari]SFJ78717.1 DNA-binding transcriptional regulator, GntR family [Amycolatopsis sacchari]